MSDILKIEDLVIQYDTDSGCVHALNGLSLTLHGIDPVSTGKDCQW